MAASHVLKIAAGNEVRTAMTILNLDGGTELAATSTIGLTIATTLKGVEVNAAEAVLYTAAETVSNHDAVRDFCNQATAAIDGATVYFSENAFDQFAIHVDGINQVADGVALTLPVVTVV